MDVKCTLVAPGGHGCWGGLVREAVVSRLREAVAALAGACRGLGSHAEGVAHRALEGLLVRVAVRVPFGHQHAVLGDAHALEHGLEVSGIAPGGATLVIHAERQDHQALAHVMDLALDLLGAVAAGIRVAAVRDDEHEGLGLHAVVFELFDLGVHIGERFDRASVERGHATGLVVGTGQLGIAGDVAFVDLATVERDHHQVDGLLGLGTAQTVDEHLVEAIDHQRGVVGVGDGTGVVHDHRDEEHPSRLDVVDLDVEAGAGMVNTATRHLDVVVGVGRGALLRAIEEAVEGGDVFARHVVPPSEGSGGVVSEG